MTATMPPLHAALFTTPFGGLAVLVTPEDGVVRASGFHSLREAERTLPPHLSNRGWTEANLPSVAAAVAAWLGGDADALSQVATEQEGAAFMQRVWAAMRAIPGGEVATYGELAQAAGSPRAARAAGHACASNALAPFVPCHRVVAAHGIGNYGYGVDVKRAMLALEGAVVRERPTTVRPSR